MIWNHPLYALYILILPESKSNSRIDKEMVRKRNTQETTGRICKLHLTKALSFTAAVVSQQIFLKEEV